MSHIRNIINCIKYILLIQLPILTVAQTDSNISESRNIRNAGCFFHNTELMLITYDSSITLSVHSLSVENDSNITGDFAITFNRSLRYHDGNQLLLKKR